MGIAVISARKSVTLTRLYGATALACLFAYALPAAPAFAQDIGNSAPSIPPGSKMLMEADTLVYDNDANTVTAVGGVQIDYGGNRLVAQRVAYDRKSSRLVASGNVAVINSDGTKMYSQEIDVTDDFADGFINALRVETVDKTYFAAESAERKSGTLTTFNNGVYTACAPCEEKPDKAPIWRIKAQKIIWNGKTKVVRFEKSKFEFFGFPIAYLPAFEIADPSVKRKSGFLFPSFSQSSQRGFGVAVPYYFALSPTYDLTLTGTGYTKQGFLGQAEWNQRFNNGQYSITVAGMRQNDPEAFLNNGNATVDSGQVSDLTKRFGVNDPNEFRGMIGTTGHFNINPRWAFGWDILAQTDKNFARSYSIDGYDETIHRSEIYLTGLNDRNYFDLRGMKFQVQESSLDKVYNSAGNLVESSSARNDKQPWALSQDYSYTPDEPVFGGELNFDLNARVVHRAKLDSTATTPLVRGIDGTSSRLTAEAEWKRSFITDGGLVVTPLLAFQMDGTGVNQTSASVNAINAMAGALPTPVDADVRSAYYRSMATAGLELRWPVLFSFSSGSHVLEPMAQVFARPDEAYADTLGIPNEDAQSFVFDATTLFERDKFSGYDRMEGGTRANVGLRYSGSFNNGWTTNALFGQSYQLAGRNSFDSPDLVNAGAYSGLETDESDFVGLVGFATPFGLSSSVSARLDDQTAEVRRAELKAGYTSTALSLTAQYAFIQAQPLYGFSTDRKEVTLGASVRFHENWRTYGSGTYDFESGVLTRNAVGFAYDDECFTYAMTMSQKRDANPNVSLRQENETTFGFNVSFRTLGDFGSTTGQFGQQ